MKIYLKIPAKLATQHKIWEYSNRFINKKYRSVDRIKHKTKHRKLTERAYNYFCQSLKNWFVKDNIIIEFDLFLNEARVLTKEEVNSLSNCNRFND